MKTTPSHDSSNLPTEQATRSPGIGPWAPVVGVLGLVCSLASVPGVATAHDEFGCAPSSDNGAKAATDMRQLATLTRDDGTCVQFREVLPGEVAVTGHGPSGALPPSALFPDLHEMNMIDLYEALSDGAAAPAALVAAQRRVDQLVGDEPGAETSGSSAPRGDSQGASAAVGDGQAAASASSALKSMSAADFESTYCDSAYDFSRCRTNRTGNTPLVEYQATLGEVYAHPYRGDIHMRLEYRNFWGWHDTAHLAITEDNTGWALGFGSRKRRRANIHQGSGDGYHWVFQGAF